MFKRFWRFKKRMMRKFPLVTFFGVLVILFAVIFVGNSMRQPDETVNESDTQIKETETFSFGEVPYLSLTGKVDKKRVIDIKATSNGIVKNINVVEGKKVSVGSVLVSLSDTYGGANIAAVDSQIAQRTKEIQDITYEKNEDVLDYQRDEVPKTDSDASEIARKQVTIQKRNLDLNRDVIDLNLKKARIANALNYPSAPTPGIVEKIYVKPGQQVQAGTPLLSFLTDNDTATLEVLVSLNIAKLIAVDKPSFIQINGSDVIAHPVYISREATNGQQYTVLYSIPSEHLDKVANQGFLEVNIPLENSYSSFSAPMVPIDAVQVTQDSSYVFLLVEGKAESREVTLGNVYGGFVQVVEGINLNDEIILNRNIFHGDRVSKIEK